MATCNNFPLQVGARIKVPAGMYAPISWVDTDEGRRCDVGTVVETGHLVAVRFDGYPNVVDYSAREAQQLTEVL